MQREELPAAGDHDGAGGPVKSPDVAGETGNTLAAAGETGKSRWGVSRAGTAVAIMLLLFLGLRLTGSVGGGSAHHRKSVSGSDSSLNNDSLQQLLGTDVQAKTAFLMSYATPGSVVKPDPKFLRDALRSAEALDVRTHNSPGAARRVMVLRSLLGLKPDEMIKRTYLPLNAFTKDLPATVSPEEKARFRSQGRAWQVVVSHKASPKQYAEAARTIGDAPGIGWWRWPSLMVVQNASGEMSEANQHAAAARDRALMPILGIIGLILLKLGLGVLGAVLLTVGIVAAVHRFKGDSVSHFYGLWRYEPGPATQSGLRLTARDLLCVFVTYLFVSEILSVLLGGFSGFGPDHAWKFSGALTPYTSAIKAMSAERRSVLNAELSAVGYIVSALPSFGVLVLLARYRGASLSEVGWTKRQSFINVIYGIAGFGISTPVMLIVAFIVQRLFKSAPDPSNPVIPDLVQSPSMLATTIIILLAVACAPVVEELLFRGALYHGVRLRLGVWPAIVISGLVFGMIHPVGIAEKLELSSLGMVFAWMAETRKSLVPSMVAHALNNGMSTALLLLALKG